MRSLYVLNILWNEVFLASENEERTYDFLGPRSVKMTRNSIWTECFNFTFDWLYYSSWTFLETRVYQQSWRKFTRWAAPSLR
jgi:hypothetical protein